MSVVLALLSIVVLVLSGKLVTGVTIIPRLTAKSRAPVFDS
jgi:hypothetical protein